MDNTIITFIILGLIILAILGYHAFYVRETNKEKTKLINALISKSATELRDLELTEKVRPIKAEIPKEPDLIPESELNDDEFMEKVIGKEIG